MLATSALMLGVLILGTRTLVAASNERPNIILIMADDLGWSDLHCQGNESLETPHLDRLATQGMRFTDGYAAAPVCTPTRAAIMTGQSPARLGITNHAPGNPEHRDKAGWKGAPWTTYLDLEYETMAERLKSSGYTTGFVGKWHLSHRPGRDANGLLEERLRPEHQGFDLNVGGCRFGGPPTYFDPYRIPNIAPRSSGEYLPDRLADESIQFIRSNQGKPFFLCWWNYAVHYPIEAPATLIAKYESRGVENPAYAAMIEAMDSAIGRLLLELARMQLDENTFLIFTSDNGSLFGNQPLRANKGFLYEGGIRVPWIIRWPGKINAGSISDQPIISTDCFPTILEVAGVDRDDDEVTDGESLVPLLVRGEKLHRDALYFHYPNYAFHKRNRLGSAIRVGKYKLIRFFNDATIELYDLSTDLGEQNNLAMDLPEVANDLQDRLSKWLASSGAKLPIAPE